MVPTLSSHPPAARSAVFQACDEFQRSHRLSRRALLRIGAVGLTGLSLPNILRAEKAARPRKATAKSVIMLFQFGGPSHLDTFDPKPAAPSGIRGEFKTMQSRTPGLLVTEHLPKLAKCSDLYAVVRSVHHTRSAHNSGAYYSLTGREPLIDIVTANASATDFPHPGSIVDYLGRRTENGPVVRRAADHDRGRPLPHARRVRGVAWQGPRPALGPQRPQRARLQGGRAGAAGRGRYRPHRRPQGHPGRARGAQRPGRTHRGDQGDARLPGPRHGPPDLHADPEGVRHPRGDRRRSASATAGTPTARACCSPGGSSRRVCAS